MSAKELSVLRAGVEAKAGAESPTTAGTEQSGMPRIPEELSILPVRGLVIFPGTIIPLTIQRAASLKLLDDTLPRTKVIGLLTQRDETKEEPTPQDLYSVGTDAPEQARLMILKSDSPEQLADFLAPNLNVDFAQKQVLLQELDVEKRVNAIQKQISAQLEIAEIQQKLQKDVASQFSDAQRRAYLRSQIKAIQRELGEAEGGGEEQAQQLRARLEEAKPPEEVMKQAERELKRLDFIPPASPEFSVIVSYIEIIADLPWNKLSEDNLDLDQAQKILDRDHYDLEKVKKRLIEYLAVRKLNPQGHGAILCFLGPPGVGKTSLGQSI